MSLQILFLLITSCLFLVFGIFFFHYGRGPFVNRKPNYLAFFVLGAVWILVGFLLEVYLLAGIGLVLGALGISKKNQWHEKRQLTRQEKKIRNTAIIGLLVFIIMGFFIYLLRPGF